MKRISEDDYSQPPRPPPPPPPPPSRGRRGVGGGGGELGELGRVHNNNKILLPTNILQTLAPCLSGQNPGSLPACVPFLGLQEMHRCLTCFFMREEPKLCEQEPGHTLPRAQGCPAILKAPAAPNCQERFGEVLVPCPTCSFSQDISLSQLLLLMDVYICLK